MKKNRIKEEHKRTLLEHFHVSPSEKIRLEKLFNKTNDRTKSHFYRRVLLGVEE